MQIVAELSANHHGSLEKAKKLVEAAKRAGADAVKLQTFRADTVTIDHDGPDFIVKKGLWAGRRLYELYQEASLPWEWHAPLFEHAKRVGIKCFSTPFDESAVAFLERLGCPMYKVASFELNHIPLIRRIAATNKPIILSTGMGSDSEIADALAAADDTHNVTLLHCVSAYPTKPRDADLGRMARLRSRFSVPVGLSDHTLGVVVPIAAAALGAVMIEKHLTLRRADGGPDAIFSLEPEEFRLMVNAAREAAEAGAKPSATSVAEQHTELRRSIYAIRDIAEGATISPDDIRVIRPGFGLAPKYLPQLIGRRTVKPIKRGTAMQWDLLAKLQ